MHFWKSYICSNKLDVQKKTSVSHSSTESEIISLETGLRLDGLPALELWDLIVSVFGSVSQISDRTGRPVNVDVKRNPKSQGKINVMENIDSVPSNVQSSRQEALLYVFEDNEAVIKVIIKGRSPAMRHVSRTHRVALDWLFDRTNLDPKIQIKYIDTKNQVADTLTKGNFTRDEWNHLFACSVFLAISVPQFALIQWRSDLNKIQEKSESQQTKSKSYCQDAVVRIVFNFSEPGEETLRKSGNQLQEKMDQGNLIEAQIYLKPLIITSMSNSWRASLQQILQNWMMTVLGLLKSGKLRLRRTIDQGDLIKLLGERYKKFDLITRKFFSTEPRNP